jgi:hypothetical protein
MKSQDFSSKCLLKQCPNLVEKPCQLIEAQTNDSDARVFFCALCGEVTRIDMDEITEKPNNISGLLTLFFGTILVVLGFAITFPSFFLPPTNPSNRIELPTNK